MVLRGKAVGARCWVEEVCMKEWRGTVLGVKYPLVSDCSYGFMRFQKTCKKGDEVGNGQYQDG